MSEKLAFFKTSLSLVINKLGLFLFFPLPGIEQLKQLLSSQLVRFTWSKGYVL